MKHTNSIFPDVGYVRLPQILAVIPISKSCWWQWVSDGKAPSPIKLGPRISVWRAEDIRTLIENIDSEVRAA